MDTQQSTSSSSRSTRVPGNRIRRRRVVLYSNLCEVSASDVDRSPYTRILARSFCPPWFEVDPTIIVVKDDTTTFKRMRLFGRKSRSFTLPADQDSRTSTVNGRQPLPTLPEIRVEAPAEEILPSPPASPLDGLVQDLGTRTTHEDQGKLVSHSRYRGRSLTSIFISKEIYRCSPLFVLGAFWNGVC